MCKILLLRKCLLSLNLKNKQTYLTQGKDCDAVEKKAIVEG
jgi:hypothetical protein